MGTRLPHRLGGAHKRGAPYSSHRAPQRVRLRFRLTCGLARERRVLARQGGRVRRLDFLSILLFLSTADECELREGCGRVLLGVRNILAKATLHDKNDELRASNRIDNPIIAFANSIEMAQAFELGDAGGRGLMRSA